MSCRCGASSAPAPLGIMILSPGKFQVLPGAFYALFHRDQTSGGG
jgi:hypothetical protein